MNKIKIKILETDGAVSCKHDVLTCNHCASVISMREPKKFNVKRFVSLAKKIRESEISYTCCNIEVSEPKGTEVICPECKEWVITK